MVPCPGRPIVSACDGPTSRISGFVDRMLRPLVRSCSAVVTSTSDFLRKIQQIGPLSPNAILWTADVTSLYTNIPHDDGVHACRVALDSNDSKNFPTSFITGLLRLVLTKNHFHFNGDFYTQISGCSMGTKLAPSYANLFMNTLDTKILQSFDTKLMSYHRYIDDCFGVFIGSEEEFDSFKTTLQGLHPQINFEFTHSATSVNFLDCKISRNSSNQLSTDLYTKPTDTGQYLQFSSNHDPSTFRSIAYSQALRIKRICSDQLTCERRLADLRGKLLCCSYPTQLIDEAFSKAHRLGRSELLRPRKNETTGGPLSLNLYTEYVPTWSKNIRTIIRECNPLLRSANIQTRVVFTPTTKLKDILVRSKFVDRRTPKHPPQPPPEPPSQPLFTPRTAPPQLMKRKTESTTVKPTVLQMLRDAKRRAEEDAQGQPMTKRPCLTKNYMPIQGTKRCGRNCAMCPFIYNGNVITSRVTGLRHTIKNSFNCTTKNCIYIINCLHCKFQYVGETGDRICDRFADHKYDCKHAYKRPHPVARHFNTDTHNYIHHLRICVLEQTNGIKHRKARELFFISQFMTDTPFGINEQHMLCRNPWSQSDCL